MAPPNQNAETPQKPYGAPEAYRPPSVPTASGGLDAARVEAFRFSPLSFDLSKQLQSEEKIQFVDFDGQKLSDLRVMGPSGEYVGRDKQRGDRITEINFAGNKKSASVSYGTESATTPNRIDLTEKQSDGSVSRTSYRHEENGKWGLYINDRRLTYLPGEVKLSSDGTISHDTGDGFWHTERVDGTVLSEKQLTNGARVAVGDDGNVTQITRPDGSRVEVNKVAGEISTLSEIDQNGERVEWSQNDGKWTSLQKPGESRTDLKLFNNGLLTYQSGDKQHHILANGSDLQDSLSSSGIKFDENGQLKSITYPNGDKRSIVFEEGSDKVKSITYTVKKTGQTHEYTRIGSENKFGYKLTEANGRTKSGNWNGSIEYSSDGMFTIRDGEGNGRKVDGFCTKTPLDGKTYLEKKNADGSVLICNPQKEMTALLRQDGSRVDCERADGQIVKVVDTRPDGKQINFSYDSQTKAWSSDSSHISISKTSPIDADGNLKFKTADDSVHTIKTNGREQIATREGATLELDLNGNLDKISQKNGEYRLIHRQASEVVGFSDYDKTGALKKELRGLSGLSLEKNGSIKYVDENGATITEKSNFSRVENDSSGRLLKVVRPDGSHRDFTYDAGSGELAKISDVTKTDKEERADEWLRKRNPVPPAGDGKFADTYERVNAKAGRTVEVRTNVQIDSSGDYSYKDSKGKDRESKVSDRFRRSGDGFNSATIEEAHYNFLDEMRSNIQDEAKLERLETMMSGFEKRLGQSVELRVAAGKSEDEVRERIESQVASTYDHLTRMVQADNAAIDDKATRLMLAETFMYHAWEPETVNQQGWGSCWLQSGYIPCGLGKHPNEMAKVLADVSLTGKYTDQKGNSYDYRREQLGIHSRADGAGWSIQSATNDNSQPSPVAHRFDRTMSVMDRGARYGGAGDSGRIRYGGGGQREIMRRVTGDELLYIGQYPRNRQERLAMLEAGGAQRSGGPGHVATLALRKVGESDWAIVRGDQYDGRDRVVSVIRDLKQWLNTGESARIERSFAPAWNKEFKIADSVKPSDFRPDHDGPRRPRDPDDNNRPDRPIIAFFRRRRR